MKKYFSNYLFIFFGAFFMSFLPGNQPYYGEFRVVKMLNYNDTVLSSTMYNSMAFVFSSPSSVFAPYLGTNNGNIKFNDKQLYYEPAILAYLDSTQRNIDEGINWKYYGSNSNPEFNFSCLTNYPTFGGANSIPNSISKSDNLIIPINNLVGADEIEFTIDDYQIRTFVPWYRKIQANQGAIVIPKNQLTGLQGHFASLKITFIKKETKKFNEKVFGFENRLCINKNVPIIN